MQNHSSSIKKNFAYQMIYEILVLVLPFITSPYIARVIGAEGLGIYSFTYTIANYFLLFAMLGIKNYGNRAIAQAREDDVSMNSIFSNILFLHILISVVCCMVYLLYVIFFSSEKKLAFIQFGIVLSGLFDISWFYFGIEKFKLTVTRNIIIKILNVICILLFVKNTNDLWKYCLIMSLGVLLSQITLWIPLKKYVTIIKPDIKSLRAHLSPMLVLFIPVIAISLYKYMDKIMIGILSDKLQLGFYENAEKVTNIPITIISSFGTVMLPKMSNLAAKYDDHASSRYMALSMKYVMCLAFALTFGLAGVASVFAPVFWGKEFLPTSSLIIGLSSTIPFIAFANVIRTQYLIPRSRDKDYLISVVIGATVNILINALLIPLYGAGGATFGTVIAEVSVCLTQMFVVRNELPLSQYCKSFIIFLVFGFIMFCAVFAVGHVLKTSVFTLSIQIAVGILIYCVSTIIYFIKIKDSIIMKILSKFNHSVSK